MFVLWLLIVSLAPPPEALSPREQILPFVLSTQHRLPFSVKGLEVQENDTVYQFYAGFMPKINC